MLGRLFCTLWGEYPREWTIFCFWPWGAFFLRAVENLAKPLYNSTLESILWGQRPAALERTPAPPPASTCADVTGAGKFHMIPPPALVSLLPCEPSPVRPLEETPPPGALPKPRFFVVWLDQSGLSLGPPMPPTCSPEQGPVLSVLPLPLPAPGLDPRVAPPGVLWTSSRTLEL